MIFWKKLLWTDGQMKKCDFVEPTIPAGNWQNEKPFLPNLHRLWRGTSARLQFSFHITVHLSLRARSELPSVLYFVLFEFFRNPYFYWGEPFERKQNKYNSFLNTHIFDLHSCSSNYHEFDHDKTKMYSFDNCKLILGSFKLKNLTKQYSS